MSHATDVLEHIGRTPLVRLRSMARKARVPVLVKCEHLNPGGSVEDRIAKAIVDEAEQRGLLRPGMRPPRIPLVDDAGVALVVLLLATFLAIYGRRA